VRARLGQRSRKPLSLAIALAFGWAAAPVPVSGQQQQQQVEKPVEAPAAVQGREHVVRRGDTLWDLARAYLSNPFLWPMIYEANRTVVENPHWIYPAEKLMIPPLAPASTDSVARPVEVPPVAVQEPAREPSRTRWYTSPGPEVKVEARATVLETIEPQAPLVVAPWEWHSTPYLADSPESGMIGRVVAVDDPSAEGDIYPPAVHPYDRVHVGRLQGQGVNVGDTVVAVRFGRFLGGEGQIVEPLALLRVDTIARTVLTATVVKQFQVARVGDVVIMKEPVPAEVRGEMRMISGGPQGRLLGFLEPEEIHATSDRAFIDMGRAEGIAMGDELIAYLPERSVGSGDVIPPTVVGTMRVVKVREGSATVRVIGVRNRALNAGLPVVVVRRPQ
jgi:hypothetical protein